MKESAEDHLVKGAFILTLAGIFSKVLSAMYRIPLQNLTGDYGYYIYQQIYPIIGIALMLALYGIPSAISKLTVEFDGGRQSFRSFKLPLLLLTSIFTFSLGLLLYLLAPTLAFISGSEQLVTSYRITSLMFLIIPFVAVYRGYYQGLNQMKPTAYSQISEQLVRVVIIILAAYLFSVGQIELHELAEYASLAAILGSLLALFVLLKQKDLSQNKKEAQPVAWRYFLRTLIIFGLLASLNHMMLLLLQLVDLLTLTRGLTLSGMSLDEAMQAKGIFDRSHPLIQFGAVLGSSFALALIPELSKKTKQNQGVIKDALALSSYLAFGATLGLIVLFPKINLLLFKSTDESFVLQIMMLTVLFGSLAITLQTVLQGLGYLKYVALNISLMLGSKIVLNINLIKHFGLLGNALATVLSLLVLLSLSYMQLKKKAKYKAGLGVNLVSLTQGLLFMLIFLLLAEFIFGKYVIGNRLVLMIYVSLVVVGGGLVYFVTLLKKAAFTERQIEALPFSTKIKRLSR